jgi:hypothetical protein
MLITFGCAQSALPDQSGTGQVQEADASAQELQGQQDGGVHKSAEPLPQQKADQSDHNSHLNWQMVSDNDDEYGQGGKHHPGQSPGQNPGQNPGQVPGLFFEFRSVTGSGNNLNRPNLGAAETALVRLGPVFYEDGTGTPAGADRPSARAVSNAVVAQSASKPNFKRSSDYLWQWGQFLDHDLDLTETAQPEEEFAIAVPAGDLFFSGVSSISLNRSNYVVRDGVRQQVNSITAFVDASNVYGSDDERAKKLRTMDGTGRLKVSAGNLLPFNTDGLPNGPSTDPQFFVAGDIRANEQLGLAAMHTLFVREHNHLAGKIRASHPDWSGDEVYQLARAIVGAEMQVITYRDFLSVLLGSDALAPYTGYKKWVNPSIANEFGTAAYRFGHSGLPETLLRLGADLQPIAEGNLLLKQAFFRPDRLISEGGIEPMLRGLARNIHQEIDVMVTDGVRNFLFGQPGQGGFDLAALNIQRGRDHGLPSYTRMRDSLGLQPVTDFAQISSDPEVVSRLKSVYGHVNQIDLWVGGLAEDRYRNGMVGELFHHIIRDQFERLRDGDRFWYQRHLSSAWRTWVEKQSLATIIRRNTTIGAELQDNVFIVP